MDLERELQRHEDAGGAEVDLDSALLGLSGKDQKGPDAKASEASGKKSEKPSAERSLESDSRIEATENTTSSSGSSGSSSGSSSSDEESEGSGEGSGAHDSGNKSEEEFVPGLSRANEQQLIRRRKHLLNKQKRLSRQLVLLTEQMLGGSIQRDWKEATKHTLSATAKAAAKGKARKYGHVPAKLAEVIPWKAVCVDLIGPYTIKGQDGKMLDFMCLTMINPATGWFEIAELPCVERVTQQNGKTKVETILDKKCPKLKGMM